MNTGHRLARPVSENRWFPAGTLGTWNFRGRRRYGAKLRRPFRERWGPEWGWNGTSWGLVGSRRRGLVTLPIKGGLIVAGFRFRERRLTFTWRREWIGRNVIFIAQHQILVANMFAILVRIDVIFFKSCHIGAHRRLE